MAPRGRALTTIPEHAPICCGPIVLDQTVETASLAQAFRALGDETRLAIIRMLGRSREVCVCHIAEGFSLGQPTISHHLRVLREAGLVDYRKQGAWAYYSLRGDLPEPVRAAVASLDQG